MSNTIFEGNYSPVDGGAILFAGSNAVFENNQYLNNCSDLYAGAVVLVNNFIVSEVGSYYEGSTVHNF